MKICLVSMSTVRLSGIGRTVLSTAEELQKQGHSVGFVSECGDCEGDVLWIQFRTRNPISMIMNMYQMLKFVRKYDALLCYDILPCGFVSAIISKLTGIPLYLHCIGTYSLFPKQQRIKSFAMMLVCKTAKKIFILSTVVKKHIEESRPGFSFRDPVILPPGVDVDFFQFKNECSNAVNEPYILTVGAVKSRKGHDVSLEAFGKIAKQYPLLKYVIVGDYDRETDFHHVLHKIINTYAIADRVLFIDNATDEELRKLYSHAQFFIMTSRTTSEFIEGFGIVYLEAGLCKIPSIGAYDTGAEDAIIHNETGLLVPLVVDEAVRAMQMLLDNPSYTNTLGQQAETHAHTFTWPKIVSRYMTYMRQSDTI